MPLYTDMIMDNFEDYANQHEDDGVIKLQNMPEDASMEQWGAKLQEIADEFICAPRYFLMCWLASYCQDRDLLDDETYTREFPAFTYQREGGRKKFEFQPVSKEHAQNLEEDERDQYIDILSEIAASHSGDKKAEWRGVFRTAFLWHKKKKKLISKEDGFKIAHGLDMSYTLTDFFLTRVLENDGFDFTKSADVIHAYCCFRSKCYQDFLELESLYAEAAKDVTQGTIEEKPEHFTEGMLPGDEEGVVRNQDDNSLFGLVEKWKSENIEIVDAEKHLDNVDLKFIDWMKEKAPFLDLPGKTACEIFKRLTAFVYADTKDRQQKLEIQRENDAMLKYVNVIIKRIIQKREVATQKRETATQNGQFEDIDTTQKKEIATQKNLDTTQKKVLEYFKDNPKATRVDAANALGNITEDGVKFIIAKLQKKGLLKRVGGRKYGEWLVFI